MRKNVKRKGVNITLQQADEHQRKHGFKPLIEKELEFRGTAVGVRARAKKLRVAARKMTVPEREYKVLLAARRSHGMIEDYKYQGIRLPWGDSMFYKCDFAVLNLDHSITIVEVKGAKIWDRDIVRFKGCRAEWKHWFTFEFHQRTPDGLWHQLL